MNPTLSYLQELLAIASPTGYTRGVQDYLVSTLEKMGYQPVRTSKGLVHVTVPGQDDDHHRIVTAHVDTLGAMVRAVKGDGRLKLDKVGGFPWRTVPSMWRPPAKLYLGLFLFTRLRPTSTAMRGRLSEPKTTWKSA